jgi:hypothetical protein
VSLATLIVRWCHDRNLTDRLKGLGHDGDPLRTDPIVVADENAIWRRLRPLLCLGRREQIYEEDCE